MDPERPTPDDIERIARQILAALATSGEATNYLRAIRRAFIAGARAFATALAEADFAAKTEAKAKAPSPAST